MHHRAERPRLAPLRRFPSALARQLSAASALAPARLVLALALLLAAATGALATVASVHQGDEQAVSEPTGATRVTGRDVSRDGERSATSVTSPSPGQDREPGAPAEEPDAQASPTLSPGQDPTATPTAVAPDITVSPDVTASPGATAEPPAAAPEPDGAAPETRLSGDLGDDGTAVLSFSADEAATFACSLDGEGFTSCTSPLRYTGLEPGWHTFAVRATDASGNTDPTPAQLRWHSRSGRSG